MRERHVRAGGDTREGLLENCNGQAVWLSLTRAVEAVVDWRLTGCDLHVTKETCPMCAGALVRVRVRRVIFSCSDPRGGAAGGLLNLLQNPALNHQCDITPGVLREECAQLLQSFFRARRAAIEAAGQIVTEPAD